MRRRCVVLKVQLLGLLAALATMSSSSLANAHPVIGPPSDRVRLEDSQRRVVAMGVWDGEVLLVGAEAVQLQLSWACFSGASCRRILRLLPCGSSIRYQGCPPGGAVLELEPPPPATPSPVFDPCDGVRAREQVHAGVMNVGPAFLWMANTAWAGAFFAVGYRRIIPPHRATALAGTGCVDRSPRGFYGGFWLGSEYGMEFHGHLLASVGTTSSEVTPSVTMAPTSRQIVARGRVRIPSVLGAFLPELGFWMRTRTRDAAGMPLPRSQADFWLLVRPANWTVSVLFDTEPQVGLELTLTPWLGISLNGQPVQLGASAALSLNVLAW